MTNQPNAIPDDWNHHAHQLWLNNDVNGAIETVLKDINVRAQKPKPVMMQFGYYLFLLNDYPSAVTLFENILVDHPNDPEVMTNLVVSLSRSGNDKKAIAYAIEQLRIDNKNFSLWDSLATSFERAGQPEKAISAGKNSLLIKDKQFGKPDPQWVLPQTSPQELVANKKQVIAFSLWGNQPRYIFGSLRNLLLAPDLYPGWELWFYVDRTVPQKVINMLRQLGATVMMQAPDQPEKQKLCWRFEVANRSDVGYFLVRDADSVFSLRERLAVDEWMASDQYFHIIRDWWSHTDLILAGLWGGVAGVLPNIKADVAHYCPNTVHTPNIDQWYLRDCLWKHIKQSCLVHDRFARTPDALPIPGPKPEGNIHIGSCEYHQAKDQQIQLLSPWLEKLWPRMSS